MKKNTIILAAVVIVVIVGIYFFINNSSNSVTLTNDQSLATSTKAGVGATSTKPVNKAETVIGQSILGNNINAYHYGNGDKEILFVGGLHGGYEWNTVLVAYQLMDYLKANPDAIPTSVKVTVIPVVNVDGLNKVVGTTGRFTASDVPKSESATVAGRFNTNSVDLNRNFDCDWQASAVWQNKTVSGGDAAFSEPESKAVKNYIEANKIKAAIVWYSAAGGVYSSNCHGSILTETTALTNAYAKASGYPAYQEFDIYATTGDMVNWLAKKSIPAISVLLTNHTDVEWTKNLAGIQAVLKYYSK